MRLTVVCLLAARLAAAESVEHVGVSGTHRIDPETVQLQVGTKVGRTFDPVQLREDIRAIWRLGVFKDVRAFTEPTATGGTTVTFEVKELPAIHKVLVAGNHELELGKINDVIDLKLDTVADALAIRRNRDKIADLYLEHGFYLATVEQDIVVVNATEVDVKFTVDEHAKIRVSDVEFVGNRAFSTDDLRSIMVTKRPGLLSFMNDSGVYRTDGLERDLAVLTGHYMDAGYATAKIGPPRLQLSRDKKYMQVTIPIDEGPKFTFGSVDLKGDVMAGDRDQIKSRPGATVSRTQVDRDRHALETFYQDAGFANANVMPRTRVDLPGRRVDLVYEVVRGRRVFIERIHIRGNSKTRDKVIRREMKISEGELYSGSKLEASKRRILMLGFFETVTVSTTRGSSDEFVEVNVEIRERHSGTLQIGAGYSSVESFLAQGQISQDNFLGRGGSIAFQAQVSSLRRLFSLRLVEPYVLDTKWTAALELYNNSRGLGTFSRNSTGAALTWGYPFGDHAHASLTYRIEDVGITGGSGGIANFGARSTALPAIDTANLLRGGLNSSVRGTFGWDSRNNRLLPTEGWYAQAYAEYAGRLTGSENDFVRWGGFVRRYHHIGGPFVLRVNAELGVTTSLDGKGVPLSERYLLGGIYDIRGYETRSLGPHLQTQPLGDVGAQLDPLALGGNLELITNTELEFPLVKHLGLSGVVFFDAGNAYNLESRFCTYRGADTCVGPTGMLSGVRKSVGFGVRWLSPIGPLRFEYGIPLDLRPGERASGFQFTIGTSF